MTRFLSMKRLSILFLSIFAVLVTGTLIYQTVRLDPEEKCEGDGRWYVAESRQCYTPIYLPDITGRAEGVTRAEASAQQNRELVELERQRAARERARDAATAKEREVLDGVGAF